MQIKFNRKIASIASGILSSTTCGIMLYSFSVLILPLSNYFQCSCSKITFAFSLCCTLSCLACFPAGKLSDKIGPRYTTLLGAILTFIGFYFSAFSKSLVHFYITYGIIAGIGSGFLYLPPLTTVPKWWPENPFFATGFAVVGLGIGAFFMSPTATWIIINFGWEKVFVWCGGLVLVLGLFSVFLISNPTNSYINSEVVKRNSALQPHSFTYKETTKLTQFWLLYFSFFLGETAGMTIISQLAPFAKEIGFSLIKGAWLVSFFSLANASSRLLSGFIVEKINLKKYFASIMFLQAISMYFLYSAGHYFPAVSILVFTIGWGFGTMAVLFPSMTMYFFGTTAHSSNYGLLLTACAIAGVIGPLLGSMSKDITNTYHIAYFIGSIFTFLACIILFLIKAPKKY